MLGAEEAVAQCDENTIGVVGILGSTFTGEYEPIAEIAAALDDLQERTGLDVPIHVDGASGGFVAPFIQPDLLWDFRAAAGEVDQRLGPQVRPRAAGRGLDHLARHGRAARRAGVQGQLPGRRDAHVRDQLLAPGEPDRGPVLQLHPARAARATARSSRPPRTSPCYLADQIEAMGPFRIIARGTDLPHRVVAARRTAPTSRSSSSRTPSARTAGSCPPTRCRPTATDLSICRIVVRHGFSRDLAGLLLRDMGQVLDRFAAEPDRRPVRHQGRGLLPQLTRAAMSTAVRHGPARMAGP